MRALAATVLVALLVLSAPVHAKLPTPETNSSIEVAAGSDLRFGGSVSFDAVVDFTGPGSTYITVVCLQGDVAVYQWSSRDLGFAFPLVDQAGLDWPGGAAACEAWLMYAERPHKLQHTILKLDGVTFTVEG